MIDVDAFATLLADWCLEVGPGQQILIQTTTLAQEPAAALYRAVLDRGGWPLLRLEPPGLAADFFSHASDSHLDGVAGVELAEAQAVDASLSIIANAVANPLAGVAPALLARRARGVTALREALTKRRWALTIWPTAAQAELARMPEAEYAAFLNRALMLDQGDPVAAWSRLRERQAAIIERLAPAREVRIEAPGTDLRLNVAGRTWINSDGRRNMPSGEVFTGPREDSADGTIRFDVPSRARGVEVTGAELTFRAGEVVAAHADVGDEHLQAALATDPCARLLGELGIGTNTGIDRATGSTLLDEKIAGTVHLALGRSYPETGGTNQSALHWDLICDLRRGGCLSVDGEPLVVDGRLVV